MYSQAQWHTHTFSFVLTAYLHVINLHLFEHNSRHAFPSHAGTNYHASRILELRTYQASRQIQKYLTYIKHALALVNWRVQASQQLQRAALVIL